MVSSSDIRKGNILIVDDQESNVLLLERMLWGAGYLSVASTTDPAEVHALHMRNRYDLIVLDLHMPFMDGFEVMEQLRDLETDSYLPVLVITAQPGHALRALRAGARDFITKPFDIAEVLMRVYNLVETRLLHKATRQLFEQVQGQQRLSERLLLSLLPRSLAEEKRPVPDPAAEATVVFADLVDLNRLAQTMSPEALASVLSELYGGFDALAEQRGLGKVDVVGDSYMAVAGMPNPAPDHAARAAHLALDMLGSLDGYNARTGHALQLRIALSSGAAVSAVIGEHQLASDAVTDAGPIELTGGGPTSTWFVAGRSVDRVTVG